MFDEILDEAREWCRGRIWFLRLIVLIFFGYVFFNHLTSSSYQSIFKGLNLGIHELGHYIFSFGMFMSVFGGTLAQCLAPLISMALFLRFQRDFFAVAFCFGWLSTNFYDVAVYAADARLKQLPLVSPGGVGGDILHDWAYLLGRLGLLEYDGTIGFLFRSGGFVTMLVCLIGGGWLVWNMIRLKDE